MQRSPFSFCIGWLPASGGMIIRRQVAPKQARPSDTIPRSSGPRCACKWHIPSTSRIWTSSEQPLKHTKPAIPPILPAPLFSSNLSPGIKWYRTHHLTKGDLPYKHCRTAGLFLNYPAGVNCFDLTTLGSATTLQVVLPRYGFHSYSGGCQV